jgi:NAD(P)-dependent dehydrogenase (short-subunit alcohol dehydrogenase family)
MFDFKGRVAIITGAGRGIGREHALLLAVRGAAVVVNDVGFADTDGGVASAAVAQGVVDEILSRGGKAVAHVGDISTIDGAASLVATALEAFGGLDIVICNAGTNKPMPFAEMTLADFDFLMRQHVQGTFLTVKAAWPHLCQRRYGRIVLTTSGTGLFGLANQTHYASAKGATHGMMRTLAIEGAPFNIRVNGFWPSGLTRMISVGTELRQRMEKMMPAHLTAPVAAWLAHESCELSGEELHAGAGRVARVFLAETRGFYSETLTIEDVAENAAVFMGENDYRVYCDAAECSHAQSEVIAQYQKAKD